MEKQEEKQENIFDSLEEAEDKQTTAPQPQPQQAQPQNAVEEVRATAPSIDAFSDEAPADKAKRVPLEGKTVKIVGVGVTPAKTVDRQSGQTIPPTVSKVNPSVRYYLGKLTIEFEHEGEKYIEYVPNVKYFLNDAGEVQSVPKLSREGVNKVAKLFQLYATAVGKEPAEISDREFLQGLIGRSAKLTTDKGNFAGREWFRNDIVSFVDE